MFWVDVGSLVAGGTVETMNEEVALDAGGWEGVGDVQPEMIAAITNNARRQVVRVIIFSIFVFRNWFWQQPPALLWCY
jgi:hypothetical protein